MKKIISLLFVTFLVLAGHSQNAITNYYIIYVDNSRSTTDDGLSDVIFDKILSQFDSIKGDKKAKFLLYITDGKNSNFTENPASIDKLIDQAMIKNAQKLPDQTADVLKLRENILEKLDHFKGRVTFSAYISENLAYRLNDAYSPLLGLLPREILSLIDSKELTVSVVYPKLNDRTKAKEVKEKCLNFYDQKEFENNINFMVQSY